MKNNPNFPETPDVVPNEKQNTDAEEKNAFDMVNSYGTYEIQPTADTDNLFPAISQGFNKKITKNNPQKASRKNKN